MARAGRHALPLRHDRARLRQETGDDPGRGRESGRGALRRHRLDDAARADKHGRRRRFRVWIFTPGVSRYRFVYPCFSETTASAIEACEAARAFYGGVFRVLVHPSHAEDEETLAPVRQSWEIRRHAVTTEDWPTAHTIQVSAEATSPGSVLPCATEVTHGRYEVPAQHLHRRSPRTSSAVDVRGSHRAQIVSKTRAQSSIASS